MKNRFPHPLPHVLPLAALFALACALLAPAAPAPSNSARRAPRARQDYAGQSKKKEPPANSTVSGRVVYDDTNRPVRRARVILATETGSRSDYNALTDADGAFRIEHVREDSYFAFVDVPGVLSPVGFIAFNTLRGRAPDFTDVRKFFDVVDVDGKQDSRITVRARRGAALGGKVTYADGDPAVNVSVTVMRRGANGRLEKFLTGINIVSLSGLRTDDRGIFRISGLPPGEYFLSVSEQVNHGEADDGVSGRDPMMGVFDGLSRQQFLTTFYPSATSAKEATVIKADAGVERSDIDIVIPDRALHTVGGVVRGRRDKRPIKNAKVLIVRRDENAGGEPDTGTYAPEGYTSNIATTTDAEGRWEFKEIPEGPYTLQIKPPEETEEVAPEPNAQVDEDADSDGDEAVVTARNMNANMSGALRRPRRKNGYTPARRDVQVIDSDLSDVAVELNDGGRVSGAVASDDAKTETYGSVVLQRLPEGGEAAGSQDTWTAYASDGQFELVGLPAGKYHIQFSSYGGQGRGYAKSVTWNGRDLTREPLEIAEGASVDGVHIVMSRASAKLRVRTAGAERKTTRGNVAVFLVAADAVSTVPYAPQLVCTTEADGTCEISATPGAYRVVRLSPDGFNNLLSLEAELKKRTPTAPRITLAANETKEFEVAAPEK